MPYASSIIRYTSVLLLTTLVACRTETASQPVAELTSSIRTHLAADVSVDMSRKLSGSARKTRLLFFMIESPNKFIEGAFISSDGGLFSWISGSNFGDVQSAAAYNAVYGKADVLVNPQWVIEHEDYLLFTVTKAEVTGYPGTIRSIHEEDDNGRKTGPRAQAFSSPPNGDPMLANRSSTTEPSPASDQALMLASIEPARERGPITGTSSTLLINDLKGGSGPAAVDGDIVSYHYTCSVKGGSTIFESRNQGPPRSRVAGSTDAPSGLGQALVGARSGMHRQVTIPPEMAYGVKGLPSASVPPDATVVMDVYVEQVRPARK